MLDECKGEKFEELLRCFAMTVVRRVMDQRHQTSPHGTCFQDLGLGSPQNDLPLILANRYSLQKILVERRSIQAEARRYAETLHAKHSELKSRTTGLSLGKAMSTEEANELVRTVRNNWIGSERWMDVLLGTAPEIDQTFFERPFEESWNAVQKNGDLVLNTQTSLLDLLNQRIAKQKERLARWKTFHASLQAAKNARDRNSPLVALETLQKMPIIFNRHQSLQLQPYTTLEKMEPSPVMIIPAHQELLDNMTSDLARLRPKSRPSCGEGLKVHNQDCQGIALIGDKLATGGLQPARDVQNCGLGLVEIKLKDSQASGARLKEEQKQSVYSSTSLEDTTYDVKGSEDHILKATSGLIIDATHSTSPLQAGPATRSEKAACRGLNNIDTALTLNSSSSLFALSSLPTSSPPAPSLAERTRMSMAMISTPNDRTQQYSKRPTKFKERRVSQQHPVNQFETPVRGRTSEARQNSTQLHHSQSHHSQSHHSQSHHSGASTPHDQIFSEGAEYASVFKSRPRIAMSPTLSPDKSSFGFDNMLEQDLEKLTIDDTR
jgi:HAUS augmin-like complex subunit 6 N-terminus